MIAFLFIFAFLGPEIYRGIYSSHFEGTDYEVGDNMDEHVDRSEVIYETEKYITYLDPVTGEEKQLIEHINTLKQIFSNILDSQKELSSKGSMGTNSVQDLINDVVAPLNRMETNINEIYPPIQKAMENLQLQDIIRQALGHITSCLNEINNTPNQIPDSDGELDSICFNIRIINLIIRT